MSCWCPLVSSSSLTLAVQDVSAAWTTLLATVETCLSLSVAHLTGWHQRWKWNSLTCSSHLWRWLFVRWSPELKFSLSVFPDSCHLFHLLGYQWGRIRQEVRYMERRLHSIWNGHGETTTSTHGQDSSHVLHWGSKRADALLTRRVLR